MTQDEVAIMKQNMDVWVKANLKLMDRCQELQAENQMLREQLAMVKDQCSLKVKDAAMWAIEEIRTMPMPAVPPPSLPPAAQLFVAPKPAA